MAGKSLAFLLALAAALAGCIAAPSPGAEEPAPLVAEATPAMPSFLLQGQGCIEGGGHSAHPKWDDYLPAPWVPADVQDDVGPVLLTSEWYFHPLEATAEETMGNYHATVVCEGWTLDGMALEGHVFGFVGMKVEPPAFDTAEPADRHYLVTVLGTSDRGLHEFLHGAGFHATSASGLAEFGAGGMFHNLLDTTDHGVYESWFKAVEVGEAPQRIRLWWQMENEDGTFSPISLDMANDAGRHLRGEGTAGYFSHLRTEDHAPLPGAVGEIYGLAYAGLDRTITLGPRYPDMKLEEAYVHV
jgi:hypothetical protein